MWSNTKIELMVNSLPLGRWVAEPLSLWAVELLSCWAVLAIVSSAHTTDWSALCCASHTRLCAAQHLLASQLARRAWLSLGSCDQRWCCCCNTAAVRDVHLLRAVLRADATDSLGLGAGCVRGCTIGGALVALAAQIVWAEVQCAVLVQHCATIAYEHCIWTLHMNIAYKHCIWFGAHMATENWR